MKTSVILGLSITLGLALFGCSSNQASGVDAAGRDSTGRVEQGIGDRATAVDGAAGTDKLASADTSSADNRSAGAITAEQVLKACTLFISCLTPTLGVHSCLREVYGKGGMLGESAIACLASADSCQGMKSCVGASVQTSSACASDESGKKCADSTTLLLCSKSGPDTYIDCQQRYGTNCTESLLGGECSDGTSCTTAETSCRNNLVLECKGGVEVYTEPPCQQLGQVCQEGNCAGAGLACTSSSCSGSTAYFCINGYRKTLSCAALGPGFSCSEVGSAVRCQQGSACNLFDTSVSESCSGDKLVVCNAGKEESVDCKALGFSGCSSKACAR